MGYSPWGCKEADMTGQLSTAAAAAKSLQLCPTLRDSMDCSPPGSTVHGIHQARTVEWVAMPSFRRFFLAQELNSCLLTSLALAGGSFTTRATWEAPPTSMHVT